MHDEDAQPSLPDPDTMTVAEMDRELERLRGERRRALAELRTPDAGPWHGPGAVRSALTPSMRLDHLDIALAWLRTRRRRAAARLHDPAESARRRARRGAALARWMETRVVTPGQMRGIAALADEEDRRLFSAEALAADGWRRDARGRWHGPASPGACEGPVADVVVLARARAEVDAALGLDTGEEAPTASELVALDEECADGAPPVPEGFEDAVSFDAEAAAALDAEFAALAEAFARAYPAGAAVDAYAERIEARARALVAERVAAARAALEAAHAIDGPSG